MTAAPPTQVSPHAWRVLAVCSIGVFLVFLDTTIVNVAFDAIGADFKASTSGLSWVLNAYSIVFAALLVPVGRLADQVGRRRTFLVGITVFGVTSALCGLAPGTGWLVGARALQAVGAALVVPSSLALLLPEFPLAKRSLAVGLWGAMGAVAAASGPTVGALLVEHASWRWVFGVNVPVVVGALLAGLRLLRETKDETARGVPDPLGVLLVAGATALLSAGVVEGPDWGWGSWRVAGAFAVSAVLLVALAIRTRTAANPVVDPALFRVGSFRAANVGTMLFATAFYANGLCNILFLQKVWQWSVLEAALAVTPSPIVAALLAGPAGRLADAIGHRAVIVPGTLLLGGGQLWFALAVGAHPHYAVAWLPGAVMVGAGIGLAFATYGAAAAQSLPPARFGVGSAVNSSFRQLGAVVGISLFVAVVGTPRTLDAALDAFHRSWYVIAVVALLSAGAALLLPARERTTATPPVGLEALAVEA